jgi:heme oxygenase (biliverdin-IX-beta and delta-forming)
MMRGREPLPPHAALRAATAEAHERLHHLAAFAALAAGRLDRSTYRDLLGRMLGFHDPIESAIAGSMGDAAFGLDLLALRRAPKLCDDLRALGLGQAAIDALPRAPTPAFAAAPAAVGALYVTEGATLGGRQLARGLDPLLGAGVLGGRRFLLAGTDPGRPTWREVRAAIDRCGAEPGALAAMIEGAATTFAAFAAWFATPGTAVTGPALAPAAG